MNTYVSEELFKLRIVYKLSSFKFIIVLSSQFFDYLSFRKNWVTHPECQKNLMVYFRILMHLKEKVWVL